MAEERMDLAGEFDIETPEQVAFRMQRAGIGTRMVAAVVDTLILAVLYLAVILVVTVGGPLFASVTQAVERLSRGDSDPAALWFIAILILALSFLGWAYYIFFESYWNGQTPGKRALGIRVVQDTGVPCTFGAVVIRNLLRIIDGQLAYAVGLFVIFLSPEEKRLGDLVAGTIVVREQRGAAGRLRFGEPTALGRTVDPALLDLVRDYYERADTMDDQARERVARELLGRMRAALGRDDRTGLRTGSELVKLATELLERERTSATPPPR